MRAQSIVDALARLEPAVRVAGREYKPASIEQLMQDNNVAAVSIAVIDDGQIVWAKAFGQADTSTGQAATAGTLFQAASVSKPVAASGALVLVEQGKAKLDAPVNEQLTSWRIPDSAVSPGSAVMLRHLLTHTGGLTVHGFGGYEAGLPMPSLLQVLNGEKPANSNPVRIDLKPGSEWRYSGGGFTVLQQLMSDVSGAAFPDLMDTLVLKPVGMTASTYRQPLPDDRAALAATAHLGTGTPIKGRFHIYPEMAAAGLWTTPTDLARWVNSLTAAYNGASGEVLQSTTARQMLTPGNGDWGLGLEVRGQGQEFRFSHSGANEGFRSLMIGYPTRRDGVVVMANSDSGGSLFGPINIALAKVLGWTEVKPRVLTPAPLAAKDRAAILGRYRQGPITVDIAMKGDRIIATQDGSAFELVPVGTDLFASPDVGLRLKFTRDASTGQVTGLSSGGITLVRQ